MNVLRLTSVFEPSPGPSLAARWDPVGGMQVHTAQLTRSLQRLGVRQTVVTAYRPGSPRTEGAAPGVSVRRVGCRVPVCRQLYALPAAAVLTRAVAAADLLHVHAGEDLAVLPLALAVSRRAGVPLVVTVHCSLRHTISVTGPRSGMLRLLGGPAERVTLNRAAAVITLTGRARADAVSDGADPVKVEVIPSGFDRALFRGALSDPIPHIPRPRIVFVGRLAAQKGLQTLLRALRRVRTPANVAIVGDGPARGGLERSARAVTGRRIHFTGFLPHTTVPAILANADVVVMPSRYEELGSVLVEAMAAGAPNAATRVGGIPDLLEDGRCGLLVAPDEATAMARSIDEVLTDEDLAGRLGAAGRRRAQQYSWETLGVQTRDLHAHVLGGRT